MRLDLILATFLAAGAAAAQERPVVAVVNYPLAYFAERLAGDGVQVLFDVPEDRDPALWRPMPNQIAAIQQADLVALNGAGYAGWTTRVSLPRARLVDTSAPFAGGYIPTETITHSHGADGAHSHTGMASHTWLDFEQAATQAVTLGGAMTRAMPDLAETVEANAGALAADLAALDARAAEVGRALDGRVIAATHPRYQYFARAYKLEIHALDWAAGEMPDAGQWAALEALVDETGADLLIWEAAPPDAARARVASMGLDDAVLPPLAHRPAEGDFLSAMQAGLDDLARAAAP